MSSKEFFSKQLGLAKLLDKNNVTEILKVSYKNSFKLIVRLKTSEDAESLIKFDLVKQKERICRKRNEVVFSYDVVRDIDIDIEENESKDIFESNYEILAVKRLFKKI